MAQPTPPPIDTSDPDAQVRAVPVDPAAAPMTAPGPRAETPGTTARLPLSTIATMLYGAAETLDLIAADRGAVTRLQASPTLAALMQAVEAADEASGISAGARAAPVQEPRYRIAWTRKEARPDGPGRGVSRDDYDPFVAGILVREYARLDPRHTFRTIPDLPEDWATSDRSVPAEA